MARSKQNALTKERKKMEDKVKSLPEEHRYLYNLVEFAEATLKLGKSLGKGEKLQDLQKQIELSMETLRKAALLQREKELKEVTSTWKHIKYGKF